MIYSQYHMTETQYHMTYLTYYQHLVTLLVLNTHQLYLEV